jgi:hypothetical protein
MSESTGTDSAIIDFSTIINNGDPGGKLSVNVEGSKFKYAELTNTTVYADVSVKGTTISLNGEVESSLHIDDDASEILSQYFDPVADISTSGLMRSDNSGSGLIISNIGSSGTDAVEIDLGTTTDPPGSPTGDREGHHKIVNVDPAGNEDGFIIEIGPGATAGFRAGRVTPKPTIPGFETQVLTGTSQTEWNDPSGSGGHVDVNADPSSGRLTVSNIGSSGLDGIISTSTPTLVTHTLGAGGGTGGSVWLQAEAFPMGGRIGVNNNSPAFEVDVVGTICATSGVCPSDQRLKKDVAPLSGALETIQALQGVTFEWKQDELPDRNFSDEEQVGFIAQQVLEVLPQVVKKGDDGFYALDYAKLTPVLVEAVKEQQSIIDAQERKIEQLVERLDRIELLFEGLSSVPEGSTEGVTQSMDGDDN